MNAFLFHSLVRTNFSNCSIRKDNKIKLLCDDSPLASPRLEGLGEEGLILGEFSIGGDVYRQDELYSEGLIVEKAIYSVRNERDAFM